MSQFIVQPPVVHIPSFKKWGVYGHDIHLYLTSNIPGNTHIRVPLNPLDGAYWYTDGEGWAKLLPDLMIKSDLYKQDVFDCDDYALKAMIICRERYGLNGMFAVMGKTPNGYHMWNMFIIRTNTGYFYEVLCFEPNDGFPYSGSAFEIGEHGYEPEFALI
jgi:hypothetical protein